MEYYDKEIVEARKSLERQKYTTLETGIYVEDELITFSQTDLPDSKVHLMLPDQFVIMPDQIKSLKYPSVASPDIIWTSLDSTINIGFNLLDVVLPDGGTQDMSRQFQTALKNVNPSIVIQNQQDLKTDKGIEMSCFEFKGYNLDGQSYNWMYLVRLRKTVIHGIFNCQVKDRENWSSIVEKIFLTIEEVL